MKIYVARGDDTLGPYSVEEAAELVTSGRLLPADLAARSGDPAWVPLSSLLPPPPASPVSPPPPSSSTAPVVRVETPILPKRRGRLIAALGCLIAIFLFVFLYRPSSGKRLLPSATPGLIVRAPTPTAQSERAAEPHPVPTLRASPPTLASVDSPTPTPAVLTPTLASPAETGPVVQVAPSLAERPVPMPTVLPGPAAPSMPPAVVEPPMPTPATPSPSPTPETKRGELAGTITLKNRAGTPAGCAGVRVGVYSLAALEPFLAGKSAAVQAAMSRLAPLIEAAEAERVARVAAEKSATDAYINADAAGGTRPFLRFARDQARTATKNAEVDGVYLRDQRREKMDGAFYFEDLPTPVATAVSGADGGFTLELPSGGTFAVAAYSRQETEAGPRLRYWLVKVVVADRGKKTIALSDANMTSAGAADSLIVTAE